MKAQIHEHVRPLLVGVLAFRWAALAWVTASIFLNAESLRPEVAWTLVGIVAAWTAWLTLLISRRTYSGWVVVVDVLISGAFIAASGLAVHPQMVVVRPLFASIYPFAAILTAATVMGLRGGLSSAVFMGACYILSRPLNGIYSFPTAQLQHLINGVLNYLFAGGLFGIVASLLRRSEERTRAARDEMVAEREHSARLSERERLARQVHDSVLQVLTMIHKRAKEISSGSEVSRAEVAELAELARGQEQSLRSFLLRAPEVQTGTVSLRDRLESLAATTASPSVSVSAVGPVPLASALAEELLAAVKESLTNVARHADGAAATIFVDEEDDEVVLHIKDSGPGFSYDEDLLRRAGKAGILRSIKGRVEEIGGRVEIRSEPGAGTQIELRVPRLSRGTS